jgi:hypothetical protein
MILLQKRTSAVRPNADYFSMKSEIKQNAPLWTDWNRDCETHILKMMKGHYSYSATDIPQADYDFFVSGNLTLS